MEEGPQRTNSGLLRGFPDTAHFLAADPDKSTVIFRRFDKVSIRNLLNLEGRVAALEAYQEELDREDYRQDEVDVAEVAQSWEDFALIGTFGGRENSMKIPLGAYQKWEQERDKRKKGLEKESDNETRQSGGHPDMGQANPSSKTNSSEERIHLQWDLSLAIKDAVKEYRKSPSIIIITSKLISNRGSSSSLQPIIEP